MTPTAIVILVLSLSTLGGLGWGTLEHRARVAERVQAQQAAQEASGALAACEARTVPETVRESAQGTTDALTAALAPHLGQVGVSAALVQSFSQDRYSVELIKVASPRLLAAEAAMTRCALLVQTSDSSVLGCGKEVVDEWQAAMQAQAACPEPGGE
jgi:hypothetical protein